MEKNKKELLFSVGKKDLEITYYSGHGSGGTNRNKHQNCVRMYHPDSDTRVTAQECRERQQNLKNALHRLAEHKKFKLWVARKIHEIDDKETLEEKVEKMMSPENLRVEIQVNGKWEVWKD